MVDESAQAEGTPQSGVERQAASEILQRHLATQGFGGSRVKSGYFARRDQLCVDAMLEHALTLQERIETLETLCRVNNDLARMNGEHRDSWRTKAVIYADALEQAGESLDQLLDDMGDHGLCVCQAAKEEAIDALAVVRSTLSPEGEGK